MRLLAGPAGAALRPPLRTSGARMSVSIACPSCSERLSARDAAAGRTVRCPGCGERCRVPTPSPTQADPDGTSGDDLADLDETRRPLTSGSGSSRLLIVGAVAVAVAGLAAFWTVMLAGRKTENTAAAPRAVDQPAAPVPARPNPPPAAPARQAVRETSDPSAAGRQSPPGVPAQPVKTQPPPSRPPAAPAPKADDKRWVAEAEAEYLEALQEKERRMKAIPPSGWAS